MGPVSVFVHICLCLSSYCTDVNVCPSVGLLRLSRAYFVSRVRVVCLVRPCPCDDAFHVSWSCFVHVLCAFLSVCVAFLILLHVLFRSVFLVLGSSFLFSARTLCIIFCPVGGACVLFQICLQHSRQRVLVLVVGCPWVSLGSHHVGTKLIPLPHLNTASKTTLSSL